MDTTNFFSLFLCALRSPKIRLLASALLLAASLGSGCNFNSAPGTSDASNGSQVRDIGPIAIAGNSNGIVVDSVGNLYYPAVNEGLVEKVSSDGTQSVFATYGPTGGFGTIAIDSSNSIYVGHGWGTISKITADGVVSTFATLPNNSDPRLMAVDSDGNLYYTDMTYEAISTNRIMKVTPEGVTSVFAGSGEAGNVNGNGISASFNDPQALAIDSSNNIYVSDVGNFLIRKITPEGDVSTFVGSGNQAVEDGTGTSASFYFYPGCNVSTGCPVAAYLAFNSGNLYVGDNAGPTGYIRKITSDGVVTTYCGDGSGTDIDVTGSCNQTGLWINNGLAAAPDGALYFVSGSSLYGVSSD